MSNDNDDDATIESILDEALAGMKGLVAPEILASMRAQLGDALAVTPAGRRLVRQARPDPNVSASADVSVDPNAISGVRRKRGVGA